MLLASTSSGVRAAWAAAMFMIMLREAGAFGARAGRGFAGDAREAVGGGAHGAFRASAISGNAGGGDGIDHRVVAGAAEHRRQFFFLAELGENFRAGHAFAFE